MVWESVSRAVGFGGWGVVMAGVTVVVAGMMAGERRCGKVTLPVGTERMRVARSRGVRPLAGFGAAPQGLAVGGVAVPPKAVNILQNY